MASALPQVGGPSGQAAIAGQEAINGEAMKLNMMMAMLQMILSLIGKIAGR
jgi:hypothetical protein